MGRVANKVVFLMTGMRRLGGAFCLAMAGKGAMVAPADVLDDKDFLSVR